MVARLWKLSDHHHTRILGLHRWCSGKEPACLDRKLKRLSFYPWLGKIPWRREWQPAPVFLPGESHGQRNLAGYSPGGHRVRRDSTGTDAWIPEFRRVAFTISNPHTQGCVKTFSLNYGTPTLLTKSTLNDFRGLCLKGKGFHSNPAKEWRLRESQVAFCNPPTEKEEKMHK